MASQETGREGTAKRRNSIRRPGPARPGWIPALHHRHGAEAGTCSSRRISARSFRPRSSAALSRDATARAVAAAAGPAPAAAGLMAIAAGGDWWGAAAAGLGLGTAAGAGAAAGLGAAAAAARLGAAAGAAGLGIGWAAACRTRQARGEPGEHEVSPESRLGEARHGWKARRVSHSRPPSRARGDKERRRGKGTGGSTGAAQQQHRS